MEDLSYAVQQWAAEMRIPPLYISASISVQGPVGL